MIAIVIQDLGLPIYSTINCKFGTLNGPIFFIGIAIEVTIIVPLLIDSFNVYNNNCTFLHLSATGRYHDALPGLFEYIKCHNAETCHAERAETKLYQTLSQRPVNTCFLV